MNTLSVSSPLFLQGISPLMSQYEGFVIDLWGVLHNGRTVFPAALEVLYQLQIHQKKVFLLSNSPRRAFQAALRLKGMGIEESLYEGILTSGEMCFQEISSLPFSRYYYIGPGGDGCLASTLNDKVPTSLEACDFILLTGGSDQVLSSFHAVMPHALERNLLLVCANGDLSVMEGDQEVLCAGRLAQEYEKRGGQVKLYGKPDPFLYQMLFQQAFPLLPSQLLMIGDSLRTDIQGAVLSGMDSLLVLTGLHRQWRGKSSEALGQLCQETQGIIPTYISNDLGF